MRVRWYMIYNPKNGNYAGAGVSFQGIWNWCEMVESKGRRVAEVVFDDAEVHEVRELQSAAVHYVPKHRANFPSTVPVKENN